MNKNIIIAILALIIIAGIAAFVFVHPGDKMNTQINFINDETFQNGEQLQIELQDSQGNALSGKTLNITFNDEEYSITTDQNGMCYLTFNGEEAGKYAIEAAFAGDDEYNPCSAQDTITITDEEPDNLATQSYSEAVAQTNTDAGTQTNTNTGTQNNTGNQTDNNSTDDPYASWPAVDSDNITREEARDYGWTYTPDHGGHYIGPDDYWDPVAQEYHD